MNDAEFNERKEAIRRKLDVLIGLTTKYTAVLQELRVQQDIADEKVWAAVHQGQKLLDTARDKVPAKPTSDLDPTAMIAAIDTSTKAGIKYFTEMMKKFGGNEKNKTVDAKAWAEAVRNGTFPPPP